jgi:hypothetical protein
MGPGFVILVVRMTAMGEKEVGGHEEGDRNSKNISEPVAPRNDC